MWQIESREKYKETVQEIIKWIISGCDLHADNLSENAKNYYVVTSIKRTS